MEKLIPSEKIYWVQRYLSGEDSARHIAESLHVNATAFLQWVRIYQSLGEAGLLSKSQNSKYAAELKRVAVQDYLSGVDSLSGICKKYGIRSRTQLQKWILKYNGHEQLKTSGTGGRITMTKGRRTSYDERIEIVKYCIEHQNNYMETAQKFQVSYQQVYSWLNKYEQKGVESLQDKRGRRRPENEMSDLEKLHAKNTLLEAQNRRLQMENDFLKNSTKSKGGGSKPSP
ncbi:helix-turn-helix domain-containing protein [Pelosinus fermentans]|nr:helix-turn-helix domain-containing protein [Pelosinus fermentans]